MVSAPQTLCDTLLFQLLRLDQKQVHGVHGIYELPSPECGICWAARGRWSTSRTDFTKTEISARFSKVWPSKRRQRSNQRRTPSAILPANKATLIKHFFMYRNVFSRSFSHLSLTYRVFPLRRPTILFHVHLVLPISNCRTHLRGYEHLPVLRFPTSWCGNIWMPSVHL